MPNPRIPGPPGLSWRPGLATAVTLALAVLFGAWLLSPPWWSRLGNDSQVFYAAATLTADGGNPYDFQALGAEERRLNDQLPAADRGIFSPAPYAYPPLMTSLWQLLLPLGQRGFYWANVATLLATGLLGMHLVLFALGFRDRVLVMVATVTSAPFMLGLVAANPSNLLLLAWAAAFYALSRGRPVVGGALLAIGLLKAPVGLAAAAGLVLASSAIPLTALGFLAGCALFLALNLLALGPGAMQSWIETLAGYGATLRDGSSSIAYGQCCLAGLPSLLTGRFSVPVATGLVAVAIVAVIAFWARHPRWRWALMWDPFARVALLMSALLAASPYLHLNDLVLEAIPVLFVASRRLHPVSRLVLVTWGLGVIPTLALSLALVVITHTQVVATVGFGVVLTAATLLAVILAVDADPQPASEPSPPLASQRR